MRAELARLQQASSGTQPMVPQHDDAGGSAATIAKLQAGRAELTQQLKEARQKARHQVTELQGDLRGKDAQLQHYKSQLEK